VSVESHHQAKCGDARREECGKSETLATRRATYTKRPWTLLYWATAATWSQLFEKRQMQWRIKAGKLHLGAVRQGTTAKSLLLIIPVVIQ
jgi:hypothetical protein